MLEGLINLAWYGGYTGGKIEELLIKGEQLGVFSYLLPFLLIFALVNGILTRVNLFNEKKGINAVISLVVALLALQFDFVPRFFSEVFPRLGVGLIIILAILILVGLFVDPDSNAIMYTLLGIGGLVVAIVLIQAGYESGSEVGYWFYDNWEAIAWIVGIVVVLSIIVGASDGKKADDYVPYWVRAPGRK